MATTGFRRARGGAVTMTVPEDEAPVLRGLLEQLAELVAPAEPLDDDPLAALVGIGSQTGTPDDPVLARLFPDAYPDDQEAASEFRRYTESGLRESKQSNARTALATLDAPGTEHRLTDFEVQAWLGALNDLRLALGTRLDVTEDWHAQAAALDPDDPALVLFSVYDWLSMLQELLVRCLR
ncbi:MAG: DUF2017 domain-containing protein [Actinomycetes bacterium]